MRVVHATGGYVAGVEFLVSVGGRLGMALLAHDIAAGVVAPAAIGWGRMGCRR